MELYHCSCCIKCADADIPVKLCNECANKHIFKLADSARSHVIHGAGIGEQYVCAACRKRDGNLEYIPDAEPECIHDILLAGTGKQFGNVKHMVADLDIHDGPTFSAYSD